MSLTQKFMHALLVACDQSYKTRLAGIKTGDPLDEYQSQRESKGSEKFKRVKGVREI